MAVESEQFQVLLDSLSDYAVFLLDANGAVTSWSSAAEKMFGFGTHEVQGRHFSCLYLPSDVQQQKPQQELRMAGVHGRFEDTNWRRRQDGARFWADSILCPLRDPDGNLRGYSQVIRDITERKRADDLLREKEEELTQARKMEAIGRLAGGVAHDFNNFMTGIIGLSDELRDSLSPEDRRRSDLDEIIKTAQRAQALTRDLLALGRRQIASPKVLDVNSAISERKNFLQQLLGPEVNFQVELGADIGHILMDAAQLDQVLVNLLANARDAMPNGGRLSITTRRVILAADSSTNSSNSGYVSISISDTGIGIPPDQLSNIFEPFFTTKPIGKGTGLGLATVYGIVKQNHGEITVDSVRAQGTQFRLFFPAVEMAPQGEVSLTPATQPGGNKTVLVVDDENVVRRVVASMLKRNGYRVLSASSASEALDMAATSSSQPVDLLLTDIVMPGMNGPALAKELSSRFPEMAVLYMSAYAEDLIQNRGMLEPGFQFIEKAAFRGALVRKVGDVLTHRHGAVTTHS